MQSVTELQQGSKSDLKKIQIVSIKIAETVNAGQDTKSYQRLKQF